MRKFSILRSSCVFLRPRNSLPSEEGDRNILKILEERKIKRVDRLEDPAIQGPRFLSEEGNQWI